MKKINKSRYAILGMLYNKPRSGYSIRQFMRTSTDHFWRESDASMYPMLKLLEQEGKVVSRSEFRGKRGSKVFEITPLGKEEFCAWLAKPAQEASIRSEFLLKLFFGAVLGPHETLVKLQEHLVKVKHERSEYAMIEKDLLSTTVPADSRNKLFWNMTLRYGITQSEAEERWIEECIGILKKK